jgi:hypothetical protein
LQRQQDPLVRLKLKRLQPPSGPLNEPAGALAIGTQNIATPIKPHRWRTRSATLWSCGRWRVENATAVARHQQGRRALDCGRDAMARPPAIDIVSAMNDPAFERRGYVASLEDTNTIRFAFGRRLISLR